MTKYFYDNNIGHFLITEAEEAAHQGAGNPDSNAPEKEGLEQDDQKQPMSFKSIMADEKIIALKAQLSAKKTQFDRDIQALNLQMTNTKAAISKELVDKDTNAIKTAYDPSEVDPKVLELETKILTRTITYNTESSNIDKQILQRKIELSKELKESEIVKQEGIRKLQMLNESMLAKCKICVSPLIGEEMPIKNKFDFNRALKTFSLLYGKNSKDGYYVVLVDNNDVEEFYTAFLNAGYDKEDLVETIVPQLIDRTNFIL